MRKKIFSILAKATLAVAIVFGVTACSNSETPKNDPTTEKVESGQKEATPSKSPEKVEAKADYTASYQIAGEDKEGNTTITPAERTPITSAGVAAAYGGSFGSFVDDVKAKAELYLNSDNTYTYKWYCLCGTEGESGYFPTFTFTGNVVYKSDVIVQISAPTKATCVINAYGQFATNEEQISYFGSVGYTTTESTTTNTYMAVPYGSTLLGFMSEGVFIVNPKTNNIEAFAAGKVVTKSYQIAGEDKEGNTVITAPTTTPLIQGIASAYGGSFGSFVDDVKAKAYIVTNGANYAYVYECLCGTVGESGYFPVYAVWGTGEATEAGYTVSEIKYGIVVVNAYGQFATNEEQVGYFGAPGYVSTSELTTPQHYAVPFGPNMLSYHQLGSYNASWEYTPVAQAQ